MHKTYLYTVYALTLVLTLDCILTHVHNYTYSKYTPKIHYSRLLTSLSKKDTMQADIIMLEQCLPVVRTAESFEQHSRYCTIQCSSINKDAQKNLTSGTSHYISYINNYQFDEDRTCSYHCILQCHCNTGSIHNSVVACLTRGTCAYSLAASKQFPTVHADTGDHICYNLWCRCHAVCN